MLKRVFLSVATVFGVLLGLTHVGVSPIAPGTATRFKPTPAAGWIEELAAASGVSYSAMAVRQSRLVHRLRDSIEESTGTP